MPAAPAPPPPPAPVPPTPLPFPRAPFTSALKRHARLLDEALDPLVELVRRNYQGSLAIRTDGLCAHVEVEPGGGTKFGTQPRMMEASEFPLHWGVQLAMMPSPELLCMPAVVVGYGAVSVHTLRAVPLSANGEDDAFRFEIAARDVLVEPLELEHRPCGGWTVTRWVAPGGEAQWAWLRTPVAAAPADLIDELLARCEAKLEERLDREARRVGLNE